MRITQVPSVCIKKKQLKTSCRAFLAPSPVRVYGLTQLTPYCILIKIQPLLVSGAHLAPAQRSTAVPDPGRHQPWSCQVIPLSYYHHHQFLRAVANRLTSQGHIFSYYTSDMADRSGFIHFRTRFESALQAYHKTTSVVLAEHPLAVGLQNCYSVEAVTTLLKHET